MVKNGKNGKRANAVNRRGEGQGCAGSRGLWICQVPSLGYLYDSVFQAELAGRVAI